MHRRSVRQSKDWRLKDSTGRPRRKTTVANRRSAEHASASRSRRRRRGRTNGAHVSTRITPPSCVCGCTYEEHRLGMTFAEVRSMLWNQEAPNRPGWFRQKRLSSVLGYMRELKIHSFYM